MIKGFDIHDPYDAAVLWHMFLECVNCGAMHEDIAEKADGGFSAASLLGYHLTAQTAKQSGWHVSDIGDGHQIEWVILCPTCREKVDLPSHNTSDHVRSSPGIIAFYKAVGGDV